MSNRSDVDVAVVGAGPAGARLAWRLARDGARVALFDASHPREKPCGGGVTGRALALVEDAIAVGALPGVAVSHAVFSAPGCTPADVPLEDLGVASGSSLVVVDRTTFGRALLDAAVSAGADLRAVRVTDLQVDADGVTLRTATGTTRARFLVGADGANSLVRRRVARPFTRAQISIATGAFAHGVTSREIVVEFVPRPDGYIWSFPRRDHLAIGICAQADACTSATLKDVVSRWTAGFAAARGARLEPYSWPIPSLAPGDYALERPAGDRWALVGDAAGLVDPLTREGIFFALQSAEWLATSLLAADGEAAKAYTRALRSEIYPELERAARLKTGFFRGPFTRLLLDGLRESPPVNRVMADLVAGRQPYVTLKRRLLRTFQVRLAWRLLLLELGGRRVTPAHSAARPS